MPRPVKPTTDHPIALGIRLTSSTATALAVVSYHHRPLSLGHTISSLDQKLSKLIFIIVRAVAIATVPLVILPH